MRKRTSSRFHDAEPSEQFLQDFEWTRQNLNVFVSEASRCEAIIFPVLKENYKAYADNYELWIGTSIDYNATLLCGMEVREGQALALRTQEEKGNYLISTRSRLGKTVVGKPLIILVEAKRNDFDRGWGQCLAESVAAQKMNNDAAFPVYGIVTDGNLWQFGRLVGDTFTPKPHRFCVDESADAVWRSQCCVPGRNEICQHENVTLACSHQHWTFLARLCYTTFNSWRGTGPRPTMKQSHFVLPILSVAIEFANSQPNQTQALLPYK